MKIWRAYEPIRNLLQSKKVTILYGPRQVGKTTLIEEGLSDPFLQKSKLDTGDNIETRALFESEDFNAILKYAEGYNVVIIDEAQRIPKIGQGLKILIDHSENLQILVTGSSSFELAGQVGEPLTGRQRTLILYPVSQFELIAQPQPAIFKRDYHNAYDLKLKLHEFLIYGSYPEILISSTFQEKQTYIEEIAKSYLFKDVLELDAVRNSKKLLDLVRLLAFQIGHEVSLSELGKQIGLDNKTVGRYLDVLEKAFVIYQVRGFSKNLRKEIVKKSKYYFYDLGIRNAIISNFNPLENRNDVGQLWENFIFMERLKARTYQNISANVFFWRTWSQQEIDLVEEREGKLFGYECKWSNNLKKFKVPSEWTKNYPEANFEIITPENYLEFVGILKK